MLAECKGAWFRPGGRQSGGWGTALHSGGFRLAEGGCWDLGKASRLKA
jgi:hypothetical protein